VPIACAGYGTVVNPIGASIAAPMAKPRPVRAKRLPKVIRRATGKLYCPARAALSMITVTDSGEFQSGLVRSTLMMTPRCRENPMWYERDISHFRRRIICDA
jgi:hypothetical protein